MQPIDSASNHRKVLKMKFWVNLIFLLALVSCASAKSIFLRSPSSSDYSNKVLIVEDYNDAMQFRLDHFLEESKGIRAMHFIVRENSYGLWYMGQLRAAARRGIPVRLIFDDWASLNATSKSRFTYSMLKHLTDEGVEIKFFHRIDKRSLVKPQRYTRRMHEKVLLLEGANSYVLGDRDVSETYYGLRSDGANFVSRDLVVEGDSYADAQKHFEDLWSGPLVEKIDLNKVKVTEEEALAAKQRLDKTLKTFNTENNLVGNSKRAKWKLRYSPVRSLQFMGDKGGAVESRYHSRLMSIMKNAKKTLQISSPYIILNSGNKSVLSTAVSNNAKVEIVTSNTKVTDEPLVPPAYDHDSKKIVRKGVSLYESSGNRLVHFKQYVVDGRYTMIGSYNMDNRSAIWDRESGVIIDDEDFARVASGYFEKDKSLAVRVDVNRRSLKFQSCKNFFMFLVSSVLRPVL